MRYNHFEPFKSYPLSRPLSFSELERAFDYAGNETGYAVDVERGGRTRDRNSRTGRFVYSQPSAQFRFAGKPMVVRGIPVSKRDIRDFTLSMADPSWPEFYSGLRFYEPPKDQRSKNHRKHADIFAHYVICLVNRWIEESETG